MAKNTIKKKQRVAHNKTNDEDHEMLSEGNDLLLGIFEDMKKNNDLSSIYLNNFENNFTETTKTFTKLNTQSKPIQIPNPNYTNVSKSKTFGLSRKAPLMEKCTKALKQIKHNRHLPKPRAHLAGFSISPKPKSSNVRLSNLPTKPKITDVKLPNTAAKPKISDVRLSDLPTKPKITDVRLPNTAAKPKISDVRLSDIPAKPKITDVRLSNLSAKSKIPDARLSNLPTKPKILNTGLTIPSAKPRVPCVSGLTNSQSLNNNSISDVKPKKNNISEKNTIKFHDKVTRELDHHMVPVYEHKNEKKIPGHSRNKASLSKNCKSDNIKVDSVNKTSHLTADNLDKTGDMSSESDDKFESFIQKVCPKKSKNKKVNKKKSQKSAKIIKKHFSKPILSESDSDLSNEEISTSSKLSNCKKSIKSHEVQDRKSATSEEKDSSQSKKVRKRRTSEIISKSMSESDSDFSDQETSTSSKPNDKNSEKRFRSQKVRKKRNSGDISKSVSESDSEMSDKLFKTCYRRNKRIKRNDDVLDKKQPISKVDSESEMDIVNDEINCDSSSDSDLPPLSAICNFQYNSCNGPTEQISSVENPALDFNSSHKMSNNSPIVVINRLDEETSHKALNNASVVSNVNTCVSSNISVTNSLDVKETKPVLSNKISHIALFEDCDQQNIPHQTLVNSSANSAQLSASCKTETTSLAGNDQLNKQNFAANNHSALNDVSQKSICKNSEAEIDNENSFTIMPKIVMITGQIPDPPQSDSEESEIELVDVIVYDLPEKNKTNSTKSVVPACANTSKESSIKTEKAVANSCSIAKPQNTPESNTALQIPLNSKYEVAYITGICQGFDEQSQSNDNIISQLNVEKDKPRNSVENLPTLSNNVKPEPFDDCEIILDSDPSSNLNLSLPYVQTCKSKLKSEKVSNVKEVASAGTAKNTSVTTKQTDQSNIKANNRQSSLILSKDIKKELCEEECEIVLDTTSTTNTNLRVPSVQIYTKKIKSEKDNNIAKEDTSACVAKSNSATMKQTSNQSDTVVGNEGSLILNRNIKKEICDDCEIVMDIDHASNTNLNLPYVHISNNTKAKLERDSKKVVKQVSPAPVASAGSIANSTNLNYSLNKNSELARNEEIIADMDTMNIKTLLMELKTEFARYQEILHTEQSVENTFKLLEKCQAEKLMSLNSKLSQLLEKNPRSTDCNSIKSAMNKLLDSSELSSSQSLKDCSNISPVCHNINSMSDISSQDLKKLVTMNLVPLSSIPAEDIKPNLSELQCALKTEPSASDEIKSMSFGEKCIVCGKEAAAACQQCAKVFFCSDPCGKKYWDNGHKNVCAK